MAPPGKPPLGTLDAPPTPTPSRAQQLYATAKKKVAMIPYLPIDTPGTRVRVVGLTSSAGQAFNGQSVQRSNTTPESVIGVSSVALPHVLCAARWPSSVLAAKRLK